MSNPAHQGKFLTGDLMRHVQVMSLTASVGLVFLFVVDFVDLYFISKLGDTAMTAAMGFAGALIFFNMAVGIGLMIATGALGAQAIGRGDAQQARQYLTNVLITALVFGLFMSVSYIAFADHLVKMLGAKGHVAEHAASYLRIVAGTFPVMALASAANGYLRAHGDAKRSMNATLSAGIVNAILDPIFIFSLDMGLEGAALASVCARFAMAATCFYPIFRHYGGLAPFDYKRYRRELRDILKITLPAILTNIATPVGAIIVMRLIANFGDDAVAGYSVISRLSPLAFCVVFALSGAVGPIIGQNFGAEQFGRVKETIHKALIFAGICTVVVWALLLLSQNFIAEQFHLNKDGAELLWVFVLVSTPLFFFNGALFISNAAFNNLNRPAWSAMLNWGRNTLGMLPFAFMGAHMAAAPGVLIGQSLGGVIFGILSIWLAMRLADQYNAKHG